MKIYLILGFVFLSSSFQSAFAKDYIVGGQEVGPGDPVQASTVGIYSPSPDRQSGALCTGTLLKNNIALTAAHCIQPNSKPVVIFGPDLHSPNIVHEQAQSVVVNPKWQSSSKAGMDQGDIALVKFDGGLPDGFRKISTVGKDSAIKNGENVVLAGYGINNAQAKTGAGILRKTQVQILNSRPGKSEMILDQSHGRGACHGDSGGPAFINRNGKISLAGVTNRGYPNRAPDDCVHKVVYTKVPAYRSWIQKNEKKLEAKSSSQWPMLKAKLKRKGRSRTLLVHKTATHKYAKSSMGHRRIPHSHSRHTRLASNHR